MIPPSSLRLQWVVFALVSAAFANVYITQPVLPVLRHEFATDLVSVSFSVSAVILGIAISNLPFGYLADRVPVQPIILVGGAMVSACAIVCAMTHSLWLLVCARFIQGLFIPAMTTCLVAYIARALPVDRLNVMMGAYVSATVVGGLAGRLLGGWGHLFFHWRYAFVSASILLVFATATALVVLPRNTVPVSRPFDSSRYLALIGRWDLLRIYFCAAGGFAIFSSIFNYLPFRLEAPPFQFSTQITTTIYLTYVVGIFMGPLVGKMSDRIGGGTTLVLGSVVLVVSLVLILLPYISAVICGLFCLCIGFFTIHSAAVGALNRKLSGGQGRANALYVLFYYAGGWIGITVSGLAYARWGWHGVVYFCASVSMIPLSTGCSERYTAGVKK